MELGKVLNADKTSKTMISPIGGSESSNGPEVGPSMVLARTQYVSETIWNQLHLRIRLAWMGRGMNLSAGPGYQDGIMAEV